MPKFRLLQDVQGEDGAWCSIGAECGVALSGTLALRGMRRLDWHADQAARGPKFSADGAMVEICSLFSLLRDEMHGERRSIPGTRSIVERLQSFRDMGSADAFQPVFRAASFLAAFLDPVASVVPRRAVSSGRELIEATVSIEAPSFWQELAQQETLARLAFPLSARVYFLPRGSMIPFEVKELVFNRVTRVITSIPLEVVPDTADIRVEVWVGACLRGASLLKLAR